MPMRIGLAWLAVAAALGGATAPVLAQDVRPTFDEIGQPGDAQTIRHWRTMAARGNAEAQFNLGEAYRTGRGVSQDLALAEAFYERAARGGHVEAQGLYGLMLIRQGRAAEGLTYLERAAARADLRAQYVFGTALFYGDGVDQDRPRAYALVSRAAARGSEIAREALREIEQEISPEDRARGLQLAAALAEDEADLLPAGSAPPAPVAPVVIAAPTVSTEASPAPAATIPPAQAPAAATAAGSSVSEATASPPAAEVAPVAVAAVSPAPEPASVNASSAPAPSASASAASPAPPPFAPPPVPAPPPGYAPITAAPAIVSAASEPVAVPSAASPAFAPPPIPPPPPGYVSVTAAPLVIASATAEPMAAPSAPTGPASPEIVPPEPSAQPVAVAAAPPTRSARVPTTSSETISEPPSPAAAEWAPSPAEIAAVLARTGPPIRTEPSAPAPVTPATQPNAPAPAAASWRLQLGAFRVEANARREWDRLAGRLPGLRPYFERQGALTLLQAGPLPDQSAANLVCRALDRRSCYPIQWGTTRTEPAAD